MMKKVLTIGGAMQDIFIQHDNAEMIHVHTTDQKRSFIILEEGRKIEVNSLQYHSGGGATNAAVSFQKLGFEAHAFFKIGEDHEGTFIKKLISGHGVGIDYAVSASNFATGKSFIIPTPESGSYAILVHRGANLELKEQDLPFEAISSCDQLYITSLSGNASQVLPIITKFAKHHNKPVAANPGSSQLTANVDTLVESLPNIDILILNRFETTLLMNSLVEQAVTESFTIDEQNVESLPPLLRAPISPATVCFTLTHYFHELHHRGVKIAVVTNGADGVYVSDGTKIYYHPSIKTEVCCALGAGDAFGSTFTAILAHGESLETAIRAGIVQSASVVRQLDTTSGLLDLEIIKKEASELDTSLLKAFCL